MLRAFINLESMKHLSNSLISMSITTKHWAFIYAMDAKKTSLNTSWLAPIIALKMWAWYEWSTMQNARVSTLVLKLIQPNLGWWWQIVVHNIMKNLIMHTLVTNHRIIIYNEEINLIEFYNFHKITNEKHIFFEWIWSRHWLPPMMATNKTRLKICEYHKGGWYLTLIEQL
jgi:hypothetical protein